MRDIYQHLNIIAVLLMFASNLQAQSDLIVNQNALMTSFEADVITVVGRDTCFVSEGCVLGAGARQIIRFTSQINNVGNLDYYVGAPPSTLNDNNPLWEFDYCHGHFHYDGYAEYRIIDNLGNNLPAGFKSGFCLADISCEDGFLPKYNCSDQGISAHCTDIYAKNLDCQWIDVTDIPDGIYKFQMIINPLNRPDILGRHESNYTNNSADLCFELIRNQNGEHFANVLGNGTACDNTDPDDGNICTTATINILFDQFPQEITWEIKGSNNNIVYSGGPYTSANAGSLFSQTICLQEDCYNFTIYDSGSDGICCTYGNGFYHVIGASGQLLLNGGNFTSNETNSFCIGEIVTCTDADSDGVCADYDCNDYNAAVPAPAGAACNDFNANTIHDEITPDGCNCIGTDISNICPNQLFLSLQFDLYPYETSWELRDEDSTIVFQKDAYENVTQQSFTIESICLVAGCYSLIMKDNFGDGMCCAFQGGYYSLYDTDGVIMAEGASFGNEEITNFCIASCEQFLYVTQTINNSKAHYKANSTIIGNNAVMGNNSDVIFDAERVTLGIGFKTENGPSFKVRNDGCNEN